ncbi:MAG: hypothetical protein FWD33_03010 [Alphaproteobacteria bacterium]|nr:hypothetical protein [Alphaproteobacteria bacterium]
MQKVMKNVYTIGGLEILPVTVPESIAADAMKFFDPTDSLSVIVVEYLDKDGRSVVWLSRNVIWSDWWACSSMLDDATREDYFQQRDLRIQNRPKEIAR